MTKAQLAVITSVQRRRRWSRAGKQRWRCQSIAAEAV